MVNKPKSKPRRSSGRTYSRPIQKREVKKAISPEKRKVVLFNKPFDVLCQFTDDQNRKTLADFITISLSTGCMLSGGSLHLGDPLRLNGV